MAHEYQEHRGHKVERHRVARIAGGHAETRTSHIAKKRNRGGKVFQEEDEDRVDGAQSRKMIRDEEKHNKPNTRADRAPRRAKGGKVHAKHAGHSKTNVNVIVAPRAGAPGGAPMAGVGGPPPAPPAAPPMMPPKPPMGAAPPPGAPPMGAPPPGMPIRKRGGRVAGLEAGGRHKPDVVRHHAKAGKLEVNAHEGRHKKGTSSLHGHNKHRHMGGKVSDDWGAADMSSAHPQSHESLFGDSQMKGYATGGQVGIGKKSAAAVKGLTGIGDRTPIQHSGNKQDTVNIGRGPVITRATGGPIYSNGREGADMGPKIPAGNSGIGRRAKNHLARAQHWAD